MAARDGMTNLIRRLRGMVQSGTAEYTIAGTSWWSDDQLQEVLDLYSTEYNLYPLEMQPELSGGSYVYHDYYGPGGNWEEANSGSVYWSVEDTDGTEAGTANYSVDYIKGIVRFSADQEAETYYLRARSYDLPAAAAQIWQEKAGWRTAYIDFRADDQAFSQSQWFKHCTEMAAHYGRMQGLTTSFMERSDLP